MGVMPRALTTPEILVEGQLGVGGEAIFFSKSKFHLVLFHVHELTLFFFFSMCFLSYEVCHLGLCSYELYLFLSGGRRQFIW